jgi:hypothetical protein
MRYIGRELRKKRGKKVSLSPSLSLSVKDTEKELVMHIISGSGPILLQETVIRLSMGQATVHAWLLSAG